MKRLLGQGMFGVRLIGTARVLSGLVLLGLGTAFFSHLDFNLAEWIAHASALLHLAPGTRIVHEAVAAASGLHARHFRILGLVAYAYAILHLIEGIGLILERRWAGRLTVLATGALIPLEVYELVRRVNLVRIAVVVANTAMVGYLIMKLRRDKKAWVIAESNDRAQDDGDVVRPR